LIKEKIPVIYQRAFDYYRRTWGEQIVGEQALAR
jgi:hypothetical protein